MSYDITKLHEDNWQEYREIRLRALLTEPNLFGRSHDDEAAQPEKHFRHYLTDGYVIGCRHDNVLTGAAGVIINKGERRQHKATVWGVYVDAPHRRKGIFQQIMKAIEENLPPYVEQLLLDVSVENSVAVNAYKKLGYEIFGTEPRARKIGDHYHDEHLMIKFLESRN